MSLRVLRILFAGVVLASVGCGQQPGSPLGPEIATVEPSVQAAGSGGTAKETLTGPAINGVVPEGQALADMSQFLTGGDTIMTVQVKKVNLPDGTVLAVTLDFTPIGNITLSRNEGTLVKNLGHFGVSRDQVRVYNGTDTTGTPILSGGFFQ
jgi:hypothetical protein